MKIISLRIPRKMQNTFKDNNIILKINLKNLQKNYNYLLKVAAGSKIAACVKANSYGLGSYEICKTLLNLNCENFFVATINEAITLRENFKNVNIYLLNGINNLDEYFKIQKYKIIIVINNINQYLILKKIYRSSNFKINCCLHIDTGMHRLGLSYEDFKKNINNFKKYFNIKMIMSHMINSEKNSSLNSIQLKFFKSLKKDFQFSKYTNYSLGNSNSAFLGKKYHFDMIRAGGYIYGLKLSEKIKCKNVLSLKAKIIQIQIVKAGETIGYGANFTTKKNSSIATLAIGYADGLPRNYKGHAFYKSKKIKFVGNISMDLSCIDVSNIKNPKVNDWVEIFGDNISLLEFALSCNTIPYEITTRIGSRVKRIYHI